MPLEDAAEVLLLADRYGISRLQRQAEHAIGRRITPETAAGALHLARAVNATDLERFVTLWAEGQADSAVVLKTLGLLPQPTDAERSRERGRDAEALADAAFLSTPWLISRPPPTCSVQQQGSATVADDTIDGDDVAAAGQDQPAAQDEFVIHPSAGGAHRWSVRGGDNPTSASPPTLPSGTARAKSGCAPSPTAFPTHYRLQLGLPASGPSGITLPSAAIGAGAGAGLLPCNAAATLPTSASHPRPGRIPQCDQECLRTAPTETIASCAEDGQCPVLTPGERNLVLRRLRERHCDSVIQAELDPALPNGILL